MIGCFMNYSSYEENIPGRIMKIMFDYTRAFDIIFCQSVGSKCFSATSLLKKKQKF